MISVEALGTGDLELAGSWLSNPAVNRWLNSDFRGKTFDGRMVAIILRNPRNRLFMVRDRGVPCGLVGFSELDEVDRFAMIWYLLGDPAAGGKGATTAAVAEALRTAFEEFDLEAVYAWVFETNHPSRRVLEKNGFREVGRLRRSAFDGESHLDRIYFDITREDFLGRQE